MTAPLPVTVVRPERTVSAQIGRVIGMYGGMFLSAYLLMLFLPLAGLHHISYWQAYAIRVIAYLFIGFHGDYDAWSKSIRDYRNKR